MKLFECQKCNQLLYFENTSCESCGSRLGYLRECETLSVVEYLADTSERFDLVVASGVLYHAWNPIRLL